MRKLLFLLSLLSILSCGENKGHRQNEKHIIEIEKVKTKCPECNGIGKVKPSTAYKVGITIASFGFGLLCADEPIECDFCRGKGYIEIPKINKED